MPSREEERDWMCERHKAELAEARDLLAEAAAEINCSGPVAHRIRMLKDQHAKALAAATQRAEQAERDTIRLRRWFECAPTYVTTGKYDVANLSYKALRGESADA